VDEETIKRIIKTAMEESLDKYYVDRETHYQHHVWLKQLIDWSNNIKSSFWGTLVKSFVCGLMALLVLGFIAFGYKNFHP